MILKWVSMMTIYCCWLEWSGSFKCWRSPNNKVFHNQWENMPLQLKIIPGAMYLFLFHISGLQTRMKRLSILKHQKKSIPYINIERWGQTLWNLVEKHQQMYWQTNQIPFFFINFPVVFKQAKFMMSYRLLWCVMNNGLWPQLLRQSLKFSTS